MKTIVTLTMNPTIDKSAAVERVIPEHKLRCHTPRFDPGGGGINVARAVKKLGGEALALYAGGGPAGQLLQTLLEREYVNQRALPIQEWTRESLAMLEESTGLQYRFGMPGPVLSETEWRQCLAELSTLAPAPDYIVASGGLPPGVPTDFYAQVAKLAQQLKAKLLVDTSGDALRAAAQAKVFLLKPNLRELSQLAGTELADEPQQEAAARDLVTSGHCEVVVVSLGAAGVLLVTNEGCERMRSPIVPIISKVGAGDSMVGGIVLGLARGWPLRDAIRFGVAAGAACVMTPGTQLCRKADTERLYQQMKGASL